MLDYDIVHESNHYALYMNGQFMCSGDSYTECEQERLKIEDAKANEYMKKCAESIKRGFYDEGDTII